MRIGHVIVPADDMEAQVAFYEGLGLTTRFRDGERYAGVSDGSVTLGLADASQQPLAGRTVVSIEVDDLDAVVASLRADGREIGEVVVGPHERRVLVTDPGGNPVALSERLA